jgi:hypothetical protein
MPLDYHKIKNWPFKTVRRVYSRQDVIRYARGFGVGLPGPLQIIDQAFLDPINPQVLPMTAVALADAEFWQRDPAAGLQWSRILHADEAITVHRPLAPQGLVVVERCVMEIYDRGPEKGAILQERQILRDESGICLVTIDVTTMLRGDGGFGINTVNTPRALAVPADRAPDAVIELRTPSADNPIFRLSPELDVSKAHAVASPGQLMLRGLCSFGLAGRAVLHLACGNDPSRLRRLFVRYAGPMLTDEIIRTELWRTGAATASFRAHAVERDMPVLSHGQVECNP